MTKHAVPARTESIETDTFQIGALCIKFPYKEVWTLAQRVAKDLSKSLITGTYDTKKRMYDALVFAKARQQVKKWSTNSFSLKIIFIKVLYINYWIGHLSANIYNDVLRQ